MSPIAIEKIIVAKHYGFCMGVKRAISISEKTARENNNVTILNEIVHNDAIVKKFAKTGVGLAKSVEDIKDGTIIISAHGASPHVFSNAKVKGLKIVDATCPLVIHIHKIINKLADRGYHIYHYGDPDHDETIGIVGHAPHKVRVIQDEADIDKINYIKGKIALTAQTTARTSDFIKIEKKIKEIYPDIEVFNTICNATSQRQAAINELAPNVDIVMVVGSSTSANSKRLVQISESICGNAYLINSADDIKLKWFKDSLKEIKIVGLSAGASTPDFLIEGAIQKLKEMASGNIEVIRPPKEACKNKLAVDTG